MRKAFDVVDGVAVLRLRDLADGVEGSGEVEVEGGDGGGPRVLAVGLQPVADGVQLRVAEELALSEDLEAGSAADLG